MAQLPTVLRCAVLPSHPHPSPSPQADGRRYTLGLTILSGEMRFELVFADESYGFCRLDFDPSSGYLHVRQAPDQAQGQAQWEQEQEGRRRLQWRRG